MGAELGGGEVCIPATQGPGCFIWLTGCVPCCIPVLPVGHALFSSPWAPPLLPSSLSSVCLVSERIRVCHPKCDPWKLLFESLPLYSPGAHYTPFQPCWPGLSAPTRSNQACILPPSKLFHAPAAPPPLSYPENAHSFSHLLNTHQIHNPVGQVLF